MQHRRSRGRGHKTKYQVPSTQNPPFNIWRVLSNIHIHTCCTCSESMLPARVLHSHRCCQETYFRLNSCCLQAEIEQKNTHIGSYVQQSFLPQTSAILEFLTALSLSLSPSTSLPPSPLPPSPPLSPSPPPLSQSAQKLPCMLRVAYQIG